MVLYEFQNYDFKILGVFFILSNPYIYIYIYILATSYCFDKFFFNQRERLRADKEKKQKIPGKNNYRRRLRR